ncbi:MAG: transcription termination/antitermination protein NusG [Elusimicrobiota bacterium]|jgi:transcriptional antiterminator NusG|nr:transcription termination/antitermination protein NusG [Elusimicrobiota bacterium]
MANQWYVVHTYSGYEDKVKSNLETAVANQNLKDIISQILVPTEEVVEIKNNKKKFKKRKFYPGYIFIEMTINNMSYWLIRNIPGVTGFLGGVKPVPMSQDEVNNLLRTVNTQEEAKPRPTTLFQKEENIRIIEGPFTHFIGVVEDINYERGKLKVMVTIFGRPTPVELDFLQVEKI